VAVRTAYFGPGGIVDGIGSVMRDVQSGNILGAILGASNTYNNAKKIKKSAVKEELKGIAKDGILEVGKQAGSITNPIAQFSVGAAIVGATALASARGTSDNKNQANNTVITNSSWTPLSILVQTNHSISCPMMRMSETRSRRLYISRT
jgi:hypothetical protein